VRELRRAVLTGAGAPFFSVLAQDRPAIWILIASLALRGAPLHSHVDAGAVTWNVLATQRQSEFIRVESRVPMGHAVGFGTGIGHERIGSLVSSDNGLGPPSAPWPPWKPSGRSTASVHGPELRLSARVLLQLLREPRPAGCSVEEADLAHGLGPSHGRRWCTQGIVFAGRAAETLWIWALIEGCAGARSSQPAADGGGWPDRPHNWAIVRMPERSRAHGLGSAQRRNAGPDRLGGHRWLPAPVEHLRWPSESNPSTARLNAQGRGLPGCRLAERGHGQPDRGPTSTDPWWWVTGTLNPRASRCFNRKHCDS